MERIVALGSSKLLLLSTFCLAFNGGFEARNGIIASYRVEAQAAGGRVYGVRMNAISRTGSSCLAIAKPIAVI